MAHKLPPLPYDRGAQEAYWGHATYLRYENHLAEYVDG